MFIEKQFTRQDIDHYLFLLAKEYKRRNRKSKRVELVLVGGASIIVNYGFRDATTDIDAMIMADSVMQEAIYAVAEKENIPDGWLNADFMRSGSFSKALIEHSAYYKTFANVMEVRTVKAEYLLAMKLVAGRNYKRDLSDIIGILEYSKQEGDPITEDRVNAAVESLYGGWDKVDDYAKDIYMAAIRDPEAGKKYNEVVDEENTNKAIRLENLKRRTLEDEVKADKSGARCVIVGGADIGDYKRIKAYLHSDDFVIYCDSGLKHMEELGKTPSLIVGDFDSHDDPHMDVETITLPVAKDDTDTVYAMREGLARGFTDFLLIGVIGARLDHTLVNTYILSALENRGCHGLIVDDYSEIELIASRLDEYGNLQSGKAAVDGKYNFFSLVALEGKAKGVTITGAKFSLQDAEIGLDYQYATSNEVLPDKTAEITVKDGRLLLIKITE